MQCRNRHRIHVGNVILLLHFQIYFPVKTPERHIINHFSKRRNVLALCAVHFHHKHIFLRIIESLRKIGLECCIAAVMLVQKLTVQIHKGTVPCRFNREQHPLSLPVRFRPKHLAISKNPLIQTLIKIVQRYLLHRMWKLYLLRSPDCSGCLWFKTGLFKALNKLPVPVPINSIMSSFHLSSSFLRTSFAHDKIPQIKI